MQPQPQARPRPIRPGRRLIQAARRLDNIRRRSFAEYAIGPTQRDALLILHDASCLSPADLARRLGCDRSCAGRVVKRLATLGLVERTANRGSRARTIVSVTRYGRVFLPDLAQEVDEIERFVGYALKDHEVATLDSLLARTVSTLDHVLGLAPDAEFPPRYEWLHPKGP